MSLVNPTLGEITDRLTILALKRLHARSGGLPVDHFDREWGQLLALLAQRRHNGSWAAAALELGAVNAELWTATDTMRQWDKQAALGGQGRDPLNLMAEAGSVGLRILRLNDRRAELVHQIDEKAGDVKPEEKEKLT